MDEKLLKIIHNNAENLNLEVDGNFESFMDDYFVKINDLNLIEPQKKIIATYLSAKALNIAEVEKKKILDSSDLKAALWHFHEPKDLNDTKCRQAAVFIMNENASGTMSGTLPEDFKIYLKDKVEGKMYG